MTRQAIIEKTIKILKNLPEEKASEVSDFADFLMKKFEEEQLSKNIQKIASESESFNFLSRI
jgi:uncharacterized membrane-anchored protein YjiN (DUF445 family)